METRWLYTTSESFHALREASMDTCVIPMGCVEKHGLHLPLGTDVLEASHIAYMASQLETVTVFPDFTFGDVPCNSPTMPAGSISLPVELEMALLEELQVTIPWDATKGLAKQPFALSRSALRMRSECIKTTKTYGIGTKRSRRDGKIWQELNP